MLSQPNESTERRLTTTVASNGTRSVARKTTNSSVRPGNSSSAKAYPESTSVTTVATVTTTVTTIELTM